MENYAGADEKIATLRMDRLSPYERGKVEQILFSIAYSQDNYEKARGHLQERHQLRRAWTPTKSTERAISRRSSSCKRKSGRKAPRHSRSG